MRLVVAAIGHLKQGSEREMLARYHERAINLGRGIGLRGIDLIEIPEGRARDASERIKAEADKLLAAVPANAATVVLDEKGKSCSSASLSCQIGQWRDEGRSVAFLIGGPDGLAEAVRHRADMILAFGQSTFPHQLVRIMLLEQIYRAMTILSGHPYHRA